jgi:hypothetical protein
MSVSVQLAQIINKANISFKKSHKLKTVKNIQSSSKTELNLYLRDNATSDLGVSAWRQFLRQWLYETAFVQRKFTLSKGAILVLSRVPSYKMDSFSPVNADRYRGNVYSKLGLAHDNISHLVLKEKTPFLHLAHRFSFTTTMFQKIRSSRKVSPTLNKRSLMDWSLLSYKSHKAKQIENMFLSEYSILKYRPKIFTSTSTNYTQRTARSSHLSNKTKLYSRVYKNVTKKNPKKHLSPKKVRRTTTKYHMRVRTKHVLRRRILKRYKTLILGRERQLTRIKKLR